MNATNTAVGTMVEEHVKAQLASADQRANPDQKGPGESSSLVPSIGPVAFKAEMVGEGVAIILQSAKEGANLTRRVFNLIRACGTVPLAKGTLTVAEEQAIEKASLGAVAAGERPITSLAGLAEANGMNSLGYIQIKSNLFKAYEKVKEHREVVQRLYNYKERIEKAPKTEVQAGWMDIFADRYNDPKKGAALFMRDRTFSLLAVKEVDRYAKQLQREAAARAEGASQQNARAGADSNATDAVTQMRSGDRQRAAISPALMTLISQFTVAIHNAANVLEESEIISISELAIKTMEVRCVAVAQAMRDKAKGVGTSKPLGLEGAENTETPEQEIERRLREAQAQADQTEAAKDDEATSDPLAETSEALPELTEEDEKNIESLGDDMEQTGTGS